MGMRGLTSKGPRGDSLMPWPILAESDLESRGFLSETMKYKRQKQRRALKRLRVYFQVSVPDLYTKQKLFVLKRGS